MSDSSIIWKTNLNNEWRLYSHSDFKLQEIEPAKDGKDTKDTKPQQYSPFVFSKSKPMTKGSMVCTSKGYGLIQSFNEDRKTITVKIEGQLHELPEEEIMSEVPLSVVFMNNSLKTEEVLYVPTSFTMNEVVEKLESSLVNRDSAYSVSLYFRGKEVEVSAESLEKLKILPWSKFLGLVQPKKPLSVQRYTTHYNQWTLSAGHVVGLSFMPSKTIRIIGFGLYKMTNGVMNAEATLCTGMSIRGDAVTHKTISIGQGVDNKEIEKVMFSRPYLVREGEFATIYLSMNQQCNSNYGCGGKHTMEAEGEVTFTFKLPTDMPSQLNSVEDGQFPELYYYA